MVALDYGLKSPVVCSVFRKGSQNQTTFIAGPEVSRVFKGCSYCSNEVNHANRQLEIATKASKHSTLLLSFLTVMYSGFD